jgi:hypothetical protein
VDRSSYVLTAADLQALDAIGGSGVSLTGLANLSPDRHVRRVVNDTAPMR